MLEKYKRIWEKTKYITSLKKNLFSMVIFLMIKVLKKEKKNVLYCDLLCFYSLQIIVHLPLKYFKKNVLVTYKCCVMISLMFQKVLMLVKKNYLRWVL